MYRSLVAVLGLLLLSASGAAASDDLFHQPYDIVLSPDHQFLCVSDNGHDRIVVLDANTMVLHGTFGGDDVLSPHDLVFYPAVKLLVADTGNSRIAIFAVDGANGELVVEMRGGFSRPEGVAVHLNGRVYATGAGSDTIVALDYGKQVAKAGGLSSPHDVEIAPDGSIWIADAADERLVQMTQDLKILRTVEGPSYAFKRPRYLDVDTKGRMYVDDKYTRTGSKSSARICRLFSSWASAARVLANSTGLLGSRSAATSSGFRTPATTASYATTVSNKGV